MKTFFKILALVLAFVLVLNIKSDVFAESPIIEPGEKIVREIDGIEKEEVIYNAKNILNYLNINDNLEKIKVYAVHGKNTLNKISEYYKVIYSGDSFISFTKNGELIQADTLRESLPSTNRIEFRGLGNSEQSCINNIISEIEKKGYKLVTNERFDESLRFYRFEKIINQGITNRYDFISVFYDYNKNNIIRYTTVKNNVDYQEPKISLEEANNIVRKYYEELNINNIDIKSSILTTYMDSESNDISLSYEVVTGDNSVFNIDPFSGDIIYRGVNKKSKLKEKSVVNSAFNHADESAKLSNNGMRKLGYTILPSHYTTSDIATPIEQAIVTAWFRAIYVDCHGDNNTTYLIAEKGKALYASELRRKYPKLKLRFVFLDACSTGANRNWANTFKINSGHGAFIGWNNSVSEKYAYDYLKAFWKYANGSTPIKRVVQKAYADVYVDAKPVFYGNSSFCGTAN